jgi:sRNA-binding carbon storage regulator CsrA
LIPQTADGQVRIECGLNGWQIKLEIDAPKGVEVLRGELIERKKDDELPGTADD